MQLSKAFLWCASLLLFSAALVGAEQRSTGGFEVVAPSLGVFHDVVNVGVIQKNGKTLLIDCGEGQILSQAKALNLGPIEWVLATHHHRDQVSGATKMKAAGARLGIPEAEKEYFEDADGFWEREADRILYHRLTFRTSLFSLRESIAPDRLFKDGEAFEWQGIPIQVLTTPGHTDGSISYIVNLNGKKYAFTGDLIYGPGQLWEFWSLQKGFSGTGMGDYLGAGGAASDLKTSLERLLEARPEALIPSHGLVMREPRAAVSALFANLDAYLENEMRPYSWLFLVKDWHAADRKSGLIIPPLPQLDLPNWVRRVTFSSLAIIAEDKSAFLIDCGRGCPEEIDRLRNGGEIGKVEAAWISHYHYDHLEEVNEAKLRYRLKVYAQREIVDIIEHPMAYPMPALHPEAIRVDEPLKDGESFQWKNFKMTAYYFPGQTLLHGALLVEHDGQRVFFAGDSIGSFGVHDYCNYNRCFLGPGIGYEKCIQLLIDLKPQIIINHHHGGGPFSGDYLQKVLDTFRQREKLAGRLFPWENPNFALDPYWIRAYPYRQTVLKGSRVMVEARITNHASRARIASAELRVPEGWKWEKGSSITILPETEGQIRLYATAPLSPHRSRDILGLAVTFDGRYLGEFAEGIVDYLDLPDRPGPRRMTLTRK